MLKFVLKKKDLYFKIVYINLLFVNNLTNINVVFKDIGLEIALKIFRK